MQKSSIRWSILIAVMLSACARATETPILSPVTPETPTALLPTEIVAPPQTTTPSPTIPPPTDRPTVVPTMTLQAGERHTAFPAIVYMLDPEIVFSNFDGSSKTIVPGVTRVSHPQWANDVASLTGTLVLRSQSTKDEELLWIIQPGEAPHEIARHERGWIEFTPITMDGSMVAYGLHAYSPEELHQLWVANTDGTDNRLIADDSGRFLTDPGPFRLVPIAWSVDNSKIYLTTNTDSEATPVGLYVADLATGEITKAATPQVTLWGLDFSYDRSKIAYTTFQWIPVDDSFPEPGPPFTLNITDLNSGKTTVLLNSEVNRYEKPIWSPDGQKIAFTIQVSYAEGNKGLFVLDLRSGSVRTVFTGETGVNILPKTWLSNDIIVFSRHATTSETFTEGGLYTVQVDGSDLHLIDEVSGGFLGVVQPELP
jgi:hypothetical protein